MKTQVKEILSSDKPLSYKIKYFLSYYTKAIVIGVIAVIGVISLIYSVTHKAPAPEMQVAVVGTNAELIQIKEVAQPKDNVFHVALTPTANNAVLFVSDTDTAYRQKYTLQLSAGELDIMVGNDAEYKLMKKQTGLIDLSKNSKLAALVDADDPYGITLSKFVPEAKLPTTIQNYHVGIFTNSSHQEKALKVLESFVQ